MPDNLTGRYNLGMEYFISQKKSKTEDSKISIAVNGGILSTNQLTKNINGFNFIVESNLYTDFLLPKKWNEFAGIKVSYGNVNNKTDNDNRQSYFIGISTGMQPVITKTLTLKLYSDLGYVHNALTNTLLFGDRNNLFYSGFAINFNLGIGVKF